MCGNASKQIEVMCKMNPDGISVDENVNLVEAKKISDKYNITIGGTFLDHHHAAWKSAGQHEGCYRYS